jgi:hypothetical protein
LLEHLQALYPNQYDQRILRTLQRRVKKWKALHGPEKDVIFRQQAQPGLQGFSDFTHPDSPITIKQQPFAHLLYQFRLAYSAGVPSLWFRVVRAILPYLPVYSVR